MKWEYFLYRFFYSEELDTLEEQAKVFKELGQENWELVSVDNGIAYFKRPILEKIPKEAYKRVYDD